MKIAVIGTGYVGLVTGTCLAEDGNEVVCVDIDKQKVAKMQKGEIPIYEPGLEALFHRNIKEGRMTFTTDLANAITGVSVIFLALPTPPSEDGSADLSYVLGVADQLGGLIKNYVVIVNKSTVPVGTAQKVADRVAAGGNTAFDIVSNPEFLREGFAVDDFSSPGRIIIGVSSERAKAVMEELYGSYVREGSKLICMDERSAEMTKYAANAFLATKISFMNEIANICELSGANVDQVRLGIGSDDRIGDKFLYPGIGYGGSCFPKDVKALHHIAGEHGYDFRILQAVRSVNETQKAVLSEKIKAYFKGDTKDKVFALWGLAFKPDTDDIREAPALDIVDNLTEAGARFVAYDPEAMENVKQYHGDNNRMLSFVSEPYVALQGADALIIATEWSEFHSPDFTLMKKLLKQPVIFDGRNVFDLATMKQQGFYYESIGRNTVS